MAARRRLPSAGAAASPGRPQPWAGPAGGAAGAGAAEAEANPFSFRAFVRSQRQGAEAAGGVGGVGSREDPARVSLLLDDGRAAPRPPDPMLEDGDGWSSTYRPSAVEAAHQAREPGASAGSPPADLSQLQACLPWRPGAGEGQSPTVDGADGADSLGLPPCRRTSEELKEENSKFRSKISHLQAVSESQAERVQQLERALEENRRKEEKETRDLEAMVQQVEENLERMAKRAMKAEASAVELKQHNRLLQVQVENYRLENEALKSRHSTSLAIVQQNAKAALQNLLAVITKSQPSIRQLLSGAKELQLVAELLKSLDKISEVPQGSP